MEESEYEAVISLDHLPATNISTMSSTLFHDEKYSPPSNLTWDSISVVTGAATVLFSLLAAVPVLNGFPWTGDLLSRAKARLLGPYVFASFFSLAAAPSPAWALNFTIVGAALTAFLCARNFTYWSSERHRSPVRRELKNRFLKHLLVFLGCGLAIPILGEVDTSGIISSLDPYTRSLLVLLLVAETDFVVKISKKLPELRGSPSNMVEEFYVAACSDFWSKARNVAMVFVAVTLTVEVPHSFLRLLFSLVTAGAVASTFFSCCTLEGGGAACFDSVRCARWWNGATFAAMLASLNLFSPVVSALSLGPFVVYGFLKRTSDCVEDLNGCLRRSVKMSGRKGKIND